MGLCAIVIDITWYWSNSPAHPAGCRRGRARWGGHASRDRPDAFARAQAEAIKNGYNHRSAAGRGHAAVDPDQRPSPPRHDHAPRRHVLHAGRSASLASRHRGRPTASTSCRSRWAAPTTSTGSSASSGVRHTRIPHRSPGSRRPWMFDRHPNPPGGTWTSPTNADATSNSSYAVSPTASGSAQQWSSRSRSRPPSTPSTGSRFASGRFRPRSAAPTTDCELAVAMSWNAGAN